MEDWYRTQTPRAKGGVMRAAPCGMLKMPDLPDDEDAYTLQGAMAGAITHGHVMAMFLRRCWRISST